MKKILIIDDDLHIGNGLEEILTREGYSVSRAYSGTEAILVLSQFKPDLVLLDLMLPGLSGEEVLPYIKGIPVIVMSAKVDINYISLFSYLFISYQMSAKPYFIGSTGIFTFCSRSHIGAYLLMFSLSNVVNFVVNTSMLSDALSLFWHSQ